MSSSRFQSLSDAQWEQIEPLLPSNAGRRGHPFWDNRRLRASSTGTGTGIPWRDLPREHFGSWKTVWKRRRSSGYPDTRAAHQMSRYKWAALGRTYELETTQPPSVELTERVRDQFRAQGLRTY